MASRVEIAEIREHELPEVARFLEGERPGAEDAGGAGLPRIDPEHLRWFLFRNPASADDLPKGWLARAEGRPVGVKFCAPQRFQHRGRPYTLLMGGGYYVSRQHRGVGLSLMKRYLDLAPRHAHFATTMNEVSGAIYERYGGYPIPETDRELLGVLHWSPLVEELLVRRFGRPGPARLAARAAALRPAGLRGDAAAAGRLEPLDAASLAHHGIATPPEHADQITGLRDPDFLRWRYFEGPDATRALFVFTASDGTRALLGVNRRPRGHRGQVRALTVLDVWGALAPAGVVEAARALASRFRDQADVVVLRGLHEPRRRALVAAGAVERPFARAIGVCIDRANLLPTRAWYMVPADGDMGH